MSKKSHGIPTGISPIIRTRVVCVWDVTLSKETQPWSKKCPKEFRFQVHQHPYSLLVPPLRQFWISRLHEPINWGSSGSRFFHLISDRETGLCQTSLPNLGWTSKRVHHFLRSSPWNLPLAFPVIWRMNPPKQPFVAVGEIAGMVILPKIKLPRLHLYTPRDFHVKEES